MLAGVAVVWHMAWHFSLVHVSLVAGVSAWTLCHGFSLLGEQSHFSRQQMPWLWGISALLFPAVSMCLLGRPAFSRPPRKWPALAHVLPGWPRYGKWLRFSVTPFGEISWRFGVASGSSLCRTAEGLPRCSDGCLLSSVTLTDFLFFLQPWARWPSVWRGSPGVTPAIWGRSVSCWGFYVFWGLQEVLGRQRDGVWVPWGVAGAGIRAWVAATLQMARHFTFVFTGQWWLTFVWTLLQGLSFQGAIPLWPAANALARGCFGAPQVWNGFGY